MHFGFYAFLDSKLMLKCDADLFSFLKRKRNTLLYKAANHLTQERLFVIHYITAPFSVQFKCSALLITDN